MGRAMLGTTMRKPGARKTKGFTIVELMIVITVIALLATVVLPGLIAQNQDKLVVRMTEDFNTLQQAILVYYLQGEDGGWPTTCGAFLAQETLVDAGYLGQVLSPPQSTEYMIRIVPNGTECNVLLMSPLLFPFEALFTALEAAVSGLQCTPGSFPCKKTLTESQIMDLSGAGGTETCCWIYTGASLGLQACPPGQTDCLGVIREIDFSTDKYQCCTPD